MEWFCNTLFVIAGDLVMFAILQAAIVSLLIVALANDFSEKRRAGKGGPTLAVTRSRQSLGLFYGAYLAVSGLLVAICLSVEVVQGYRIFWALLDTAIVAYVCIFNPWVRNKLIGWSGGIQKLEKR
jgi:hypothetical protein